MQKNIDTTGLFIMRKAEELLKNRCYGVEYTWKMTESSFKHLVSSHYEHIVSSYTIGKGNQGSKLFGIEIELVDDMIIAPSEIDTFIDLAKRKPKRIDYSVYANLIGRTNIIKNDIKNVIFNGPATIVLWKDGTKTVVKCCEDDIFDKEKGLAMAILKKLSGNDNSYHKLFKKWCVEEEVNEDGKTAPLVWNHMHNNPLNILGRTLLENRKEGVYAYCKFNDTKQGRNFLAEIENKED